MSHTGSTGINLERCKARPTSTCPQCNIPEDHLHIIQCKGPTIDDTFTKSMEDLDEWMAKKCSVSLKQTIEMIIRAARTDTEPNWDDIEDFEDDDTRRVAIEQWNLGPQLILWGLWQKDWIPIQKNYLIGTSKKP